MVTIKQLGNVLTSATLAISMMAMAVLYPVISSKQAQALVANATAEPKVSFTFDDGLASALTQAAPTLKKYGYSGTNYVSTGCVGMTTAPNTCQANTDATYMDWNQIAQLQATYGWEIGSHTAGHKYLATSDPVDQPTPLTLTQVEQQLSQSKADLAAHGIDAKSFAPPYGDYNMNVLSKIAKYYGSMRGFQDTGYNTWPYSDYLVRDQHVEGNTSVATVKAYVDTAIANKQWLVLTFHEIKATGASTNPDDYQYSTANLDAIAAYVKSKNVKVVNVKDAFVTSDTNMLPNSSFNSGISGGWTTDASSNVVADASNNGSYPDATNAVKMTATSRNVHLFTPQVAVTNTDSYVLKTYLNVQSYQSGEVGFYIDEYDSVGNWISGQYKGGERAVFAESFNSNYKPTSASVKNARLQVIVSANSAITAYVDNMQWFSLTGTVVTPPTTGKISQVNNLATGKTFSSTVAVSTSEPGNPLTNINDGNEATRWISQPTNGAVVSTDLGTIYNLNKVSLLWAGDTVKNYSLQVSADNATWTTITTGTTNNTTPQLIDHTTFSNAATGRYFRIVCTDRWNATYGNSIWEIGIYGTLPSLVNGSFDGGITGGWATNNATAFKADGANHGSPYSAVNSVALSAGTTNAHLFSPLVSVTSTKAYNITTYVNRVTMNSGEVGFYIDEYDAAGNWISGQYKGGARSLGAGDIGFSYTPSSTAVAKSSLQIILVGNSGITGYVDDVRWY